MMRKFLFFTLFIVVHFTVAARSITTLKGKALHYAGERLIVYKIEDYLSDVTTKIAATTIRPDSTFEVSFYNDVTRKIKIAIGKDYLNIYIQPGGTYDLYIDGKNPYPSEDAPGVNLQYMFLDLDTTDINYKTLVFDNAKLDFLEQYYNYQGTHSITFVKKLDSFKTVIQKKYEADSCKFFKVFVKYSFAALDDLKFVGNRNDYEKYDFYIRPSTVWYNNDRYMEYILHFFDKHIAELSQAASMKFYQGIVKSSPTAVMESLNDDYTLRNLRLREVVMIDMLSQAFYDNSYPKTNILTILDSLSTHALFSANRLIAKNIKFRLLNLAPGSVMPDFMLKVDGKTKMATDYKGKHVYIQFIDKNDLSLSDLKLLHELHKKYGEHIQFLTILTVDKGSPLLQNPQKFKQKHRIDWDFAVVDQSDQILKQLNVVNYPYYILMDASTHVVAAPALSPRPNGEYHTIEKDLFEITRYYKAMNEPKKRW